MFLKIHSEAGKVDREIRQAIECLSVTHSVNLTFKRKVTMSNQSHLKDHNYSSKAAKAMAKANQVESGIDLVKTKSSSADLII